ncbi:hypothetical protein [Streptomonospora wellingtoniae]|uniref:Uncharacterized protein n=1 Tax=Streptomonospora wellingtoniae TaxID=3075544 RepID=A0ABU2KQZ0_9ACTN|nr:hypothetical protein [Streptomonospora sp. DSM 45055]MDT0301597.1 hypothetical protein [Streptomonospora sp. DSM 45055]
MDTRRRAGALAPERFPYAVRRRLGDLDRLREVWADNRRYGDRTDDPAVDRRRARRRIEGLRLLAGQDSAASDAIAAEEDAFLAAAEDCRSGVRLTPDYFEALARGAPDFGPPLPAPEGVGALLAEAASVETHPVIRAAHLFATCTEALATGSAHPAATGGPAGVAGDRPAPPDPPAHLRPLPWWLASLSLIRSDLPPPAIDSRCPLDLPPRSAAGGSALPWPVAAGETPDVPAAAPVPGGEPGPGRAPAAALSTESGPEGDRLTPLVLLLADLETAALRSELSRPPRVPAARRGESGRLAAAVHRRIVDHLRLRCAPLQLVLRELDPACRSVVSSSTGGPAFATPSGTEGGGPSGAQPEPSPASRADDSATATRTAVAPATAERGRDSARRALFSPGANEWHASLDVDLADGVLRLTVFVQEVGSSATGVLAVTADGRLNAEDGAMDVLEPGCADCVTLVPTDAADDRWPEVEAFVDDVLSRSIGQLARTARY